MEWEIVVGLEVHLQLATKSKLFSGASTTFGAAPNTQACAIDLAMPGTLPTPNEAAFRLAVLFGLAVNAKINQHSVFERKNYFYPDLPKGYQITQLEHPIIGAGIIDITLPDGTSKPIRLHHAHLEEDAGKSLHDTSFTANGREMSAIDLNRAGTPLLEIVSEPDIRSAAEAVAYLKKIHILAKYLGISDGDMSQGSLRCDANISVRIKGEQQLGTRTEVKNINSFRFVAKAINVEARRQIDLLEDGGTLVQETRLYDADKNETRSMRTKEVANDYRYFPCPDLLPVELSDEYIAARQRELPELPDARRTRFESSYQLSTKDATQLTGERTIAEYFENVAKQTGEPKLAANWITGELAALQNRAEVSVPQVTVEQLTGLILRVKDGTISGKIAKQLLAQMMDSDDDVDTLIAAQGLKQLSDSDAIAKLVDEVIAANTTQVENYLRADEAKRAKMTGFFVGQVMKASRGQGNPKIIGQMLKQKLDARL